ncbi:uncharacterized protein LOC129289638 [Prosopis cineraria]|uniref:uncharacterized protein LOC129289638 n=1 Tax=Prosopis cineraria TaxID=364024 RepID=UPI00240F2D5C|nr:uncharacterized protein LOC129289638 [Prosopis cineraria]
MTMNVSLPSGHPDCHVGHADSGEGVTGNPSQQSCGGHILSHYISIMNTFDQRQGLRIKVVISIGTIITSRKECPWCTVIFLTHLASQGNGGGIRRNTRKSSDDQLFGRPSKLDAVLVRSTLKSHTVISRNYVAIFNSGVGARVWR